MSPTLQLTENVYFDAMTNTVFLAVGRTTMTLTLEEYCDLYQNMSISTKAIANLLSVSEGINKILNSSSESDNYINSGSSQV